MIAENPDNEEVKPELTKDNFLAIFEFMLHKLGGISIPEETLEEYPEGKHFEDHYDPVNKTWNLFMPKKRKRGIVKPRKKLILPGDS